MNASVLYPQVMERLESKGVDKDSISFEVLVSTTSALIREQHLKKPEVPDMNQHIDIVDRIDKMKGTEPQLKYLDA